MYSQIYAEILRSKNSPLEQQTLLMGLYAVMYSFEELRTFPEKHKLYCNKLFKVLKNSQAFCHLNPFTEEENVLKGLEEIAKATLIKLEALKHACKLAQSASLDDRDNATPAEDVGAILALFDVKDPGDLDSLLPEPFLGVLKAVCDDMRPSSNEWDCKTCTFINSDDAMICIMCDAPKPSNEPDKDSNEATWACTNCTFHDLEIRTHCSICRTPREPGKTVFPLPPMNKDLIAAACNRAC
jgi:hypothetical protein